MASNARFHNKYHRRNHHTLPSAGYPDSGADPIASPQEPFLGDFHAVGALSATGNLTIGGNTLIYGNLSALGNFSVIDTFVTVTSALSVINDGTGPAFTVQQKGAQPIAIFFDDNTKILNLKNGLRAEFFDSQATNTYALAEGQATLAQGNASHSEGISTQAFGQGSHAEGAASTATGDYSHAEGDATQAIGNASHSEGDSTVASGNASHAEGTSTLASNNSTHAEGYSTSATGIYSHSEGQQSIASGNISHAEGLTTIASGPYSHAEGESTIASGDTSHAEGISTKASGDFSHAQGDATSAEGVASHAEGALTRAAKDYSHAAGYGAIAAHNRSWIWKGDTVTDPISTTRTDQFMVSAAGGVYVPGNVGIGTDSIANALTVVGNVSASRSVIGTSLSGRFVDISHTPANDGSNPYLRIGEATSDAVNFSGFKIEYNETTNDLNLSAIGFNTSREALKITSAGNTRVNLLSAISPNYNNLTAVTRGISGAGLDDLSHLINGRVGINNQAPVSSYALHVKGGNIRVDGVDYSAVPGFNGSTYDSDGQSLFDLRSATPSANYSLSIAASGQKQFLKFFGGRTKRAGEDDNTTFPFVVYQGDQHLRFAKTPDFYFTGGFTEVGKFDASGNFGVGTFNSSASLPAKLTVSGGSSTLGALIIGPVSGINSSTSFNAASATGSKSFAANEGKAFGDRSFAEGNSNAWSIFSHAEGNNTLATGLYAHAEGDNTRCFGDFGAHAEGNFTTAIGTASHAEGLRTDARGEVSHAAGVRATAAQNYTYAWSDGNLNTLTSNVSTTRTGQYMVSASGGMFIPGNLGIGTDNNTNRLTVNGNISASGNAFFHSATGRNLDLIHIPANDGTNPTIRIGEETPGSTTLSGFSGAFISYDESTNVFGISSVFEPNIAIPAMSIDRNGNFFTSSNASPKMTVAYAMTSANFLLSATSTTNEYIPLFKVPSHVLYYVPGVDVSFTVENFAGGNQLGTDQMPVFRLTRNNSGTTASEMSVDVTPFTNTNLYNNIGWCRQSTNTQSNKSMALPGDTVYLKVKAGYNNTGGATTAYSILSGRVILTGYYILP